MIEKQLSPARPATRIRAIRYAEARYDKSYDRARDLPRLLPLFADELQTNSIEARIALVRLLQRALRAERHRGLTRHWCYDPARHAALARAARIEEKALSRLPQTQRTK